MNNPSALAQATVAALLILFAEHCCAADDASEARQSSDDSSLRESSLSSLSGIAFEAGEENKLARLRWSRNTGTSAFGALLSVPIDEEEGRSALADLDGFAKALSLSANYTRYLTGSLPNPMGQNNLRESQNAICRRLNIEFTCDNYHVEKEGTLADLRAFNYASLPTLRTPFITLEGKVGREKVEYFGINTLAKQDDSELPYAASIGGGWLGLSSLWILRVKVQKTVKERDEVTFCTPAEVDDRAEDCATLPFGAPTLETSTVVSVEYRTFYRFAAVSPMVSHNFKTDETGIDVPVYFLKDADGQFTGGIRFGYDTQQDEVAASIFITKAVTL